MVVGVMVVKSIVMHVKVDVVAIGEMHDEWAIVLGVISNMVVINYIFKTEDVGDGPLIEPHLILVLD